MPAGYIDGGEGDDNQYILKVGDAFDNVDELKSMVLCSIDGIGDVRLSDVADIELTDNADDSYAKVGKTAPCCFQSIKAPRLPPRLSPTQAPLL